MLSGVLQINEDYPENIEALQYLEALCKDLGKPHEEYSRKLEKLRRATGGAPKAAVTQAPTQAPAQRTERPRPGQSERPGMADSGAAMSAPRVPTTSNARGPPPQRPSQQQNADDDDFGDTDVNDLLG